MTREEIYNICLEKIDNSKCLLMELPTGFGKTRISIQMVNHLCSTVLKDKEVKMLLLVAKRVHKQTWAEEFEKWGGINVGKLVIECYESLHKHMGESFDIIVMDECHHIQSEARMSALKAIKHNYMIGLSATIPFKAKQYFRYNYHAQTVSCNISEAIEDDVLPEPLILLMPLKLDNTEATESIEINPKAKGPIRYGIYTELWKYKKSKYHAILSCTPRQKVNEMDSKILWEKQQAMRTGNEILKNKWLHDCGVRLEYLSLLKTDIIKSILKSLQRFRTITFCKTIEQCETLGKNCIHSQNKDAELIYNKFNQKKLNHITAVNILNENANLVDCKYAIFANLSSSDIVGVQRIGRSLRHKSPVIIVPYYKNTREQEIVEKMFEGYNKEFIKTIDKIEQIWDQE